MARMLPLLVTSITCSAVAFVTGYVVGERHEALKKTDPAAWKSSRYADQPIVKDAIQRWSLKNRETPTRAMENRLVGWMRFPDRDCVSLQLTPGSIGGVPIYCYADDKLVFEHSDVE